MRVELRIVDPAGGYGTDLDDWLPDWSALTFTVERYGAGQCSFTYPTDGLNRQRALDLQVLTLLFDGAEPRNGRFIRREKEWNRIGDDTGIQQWTWQALTDALRDGQYRSPAGEMTRSFTTARAGTVLLDTLTAAAARGAFTWWGYRGTTFTDAADSNGLAWPANITATFSYGQPIGDVWEWLRSNGYIEYGSDRGKLEAWVPGTRGVDRAEQAQPVVWWSGLHISDAPQQETLTDYCTDITVIGDHPTVETSVIYVHRSASTRPLGRRERSIRVNGVSDIPTLEGIGDKYLAAYTVPRYSETYRLTPDCVTRWQPMIAYEPADVVAVVLDDGIQRKESVHIISGTWADADEGSVLITVNDWLDDRDQKLDQLIARLGGN